MSTDTTTQTPPATQTRQDVPQQSNQESKPLAAAPRDFRSELSRTGSPGLRIGLAIGVIVLLVAGIFIYSYLSSYESTDDAQIDGHINSISARVSGHVAKLNVEDNQFVQAGTVLVEIDPADYQVAVDSAQADFADAKAQATAAGADVPITSVNTNSQLSSTQAGTDSAQAGIQAAKQQADAAKAQLQEAEANNVKAQNDLVRYKQLVDKQEISQQQYDQAVAAAASSQAAVRSARANADAAVQQITEAQGRLTQAEAERHNADTAPQQNTAIRAKAASAAAVAQAKGAALEQAQLNLQYTRILAPVAGVVSDRSVEVGQNVAPGQELMKIIPLDDIWITANLKETQLKHLRAGQPVTIAVDATGKKYNGKVDSIAGASGSRFSLLPPENATGNYVKVVQRIPVKIVLDPGENKNHELRPGMSVTPKIWIRK
jgi:membrane fusion protein (multidrug efflux system)